MTSALVKGIKDARAYIGNSWAKIFIHDHIPANAVNNIYFVAAIRATQECGPAIRPPNAHEIYNKYLPLEVEEQANFIAQKLHPFWDEFGCTVMCDGWISKTRRSIINFLVYSSQGTAFVKSVDATNHYKTSHYICSLISEIIEEIGVSRVVQVVSDNRANFKKAGGLIMEKYGKFCWTPCAAHCIDIMLEDIGKDHNIRGLVKQAQDLMKFIYNHGWTLSAMREATENREILRPSITRFATQFLTLQSIFKFKDAFQRMCFGEKWTEGVMRLNLRKDIKNVRKTRSLLLSMEFWVSIEHTISLIERLDNILSHLYTTRYSFNNDDTTETEPAHHSFWQ